MLLEPNKITVDMTDFIFKINWFDFAQQMKPLLDKLMQTDMRLNYWQTLKWNSYRYNWIWRNQDETYKIFFGYSQNISDDLKDRFYFSYNPSKVDPDDEILTFLIRSMLTNIDSAELSKVDVAFDYEGIRSNDIIIDKGRKKEYKYFWYPDSDPTHYIGNRENDGFIKIYDKASEEIKEKKIKKDIEKVRIEYTLKPKLDLVLYQAYKCITDTCIFNLKGVLGLYNDNVLSPKERFLIYAIENGYPMSDISWKDKRRYQEIMADKKEVYTEIRPSQLDIEKAVINHINKIFIEYNYTSILEQVQINRFVRQELSKELIKENQLI